MSERNQGERTQRRRGVAGLVLAGVIALSAGACGSASQYGNQGDGGSQAPSGSGTAASTASCGQVKKAANQLTKTFDQWRAGDATRNELVSSAQHLLTVAKDQAGSASGKTGQDLSALTAALGNLVTTAATPGASEQEINKAAKQVTDAAEAFATACD